MSACEARNLEIAICKDQVARQMCLGRKVKSECLSRRAIAPVVLACLFVTLQGDDQKSVVSKRGMYKRKRSKREDACFGA